MMENVFINLNLTLNDMDHVTWSKNSSLRLLTMLTILIQVMDEKYRKLFQTRNCRIYW